MLCRVRRLWSFAFALGLLWLAGCAFPGFPRGTGGTAQPSRLPFEGGGPTLATEQTRPATTTPSPTAPPRTLVICTGAEPADLFIYNGSSPVESHVLEALFDGPIDALGFDYQPVILEKLPSLAEGDAAIEPVAVREGDWVINDAGELAPLAPGERVRPFGCLGPECALEWQGGDLQMAQLSATFRLREGIRWSDGQPLTAADSVFAYELARRCPAEWGACSGRGLATNNPETIARTAGYAAVDERTVRWSGLPGFLDPDYRTNFFFPLPQHRLGQAPLEGLPESEAGRAPLGWGAYVMDRWVAGDHIRLRRNPEYFRAGEGLPRFDYLVFRFIGREAGRNLEAIFTGMCDVLDAEAGEILSAEQFADLLELGERGDLQARIAAGTAWELAAFGLQPLAYDDGYQPATDRPDFFGEARTRRAIALCMDRPGVVESVLLGQSQVPAVYVPPQHPLFDSGAAHYDFDPQAGKTLLEEVGWVDHDGDPATPRLARGVPNVPDGTPFSFTYLASGAGQRQEAARLLVESLAGCGVQANLEIRPAGELFAPGPEGALFGRRFEMAQFAWLVGSRPPCDLFTTSQVPGPPGGRWNSIDGLLDLPFPFGWGGLNLGGYSNPEYDRACQAALEALPGQQAGAEGALQAHGQAQQIFAADLPAIPLYLHLKIAVARKDVCGLQLDPTARSEMWNLEQFDRGEGCR